jgi:soluble lytic murein transglycosylase-like protein
MRFLTLPLLLAILVLSLGNYDHADVRQAVDQAGSVRGVSPGLLACITWREATDDPYAVGAAGELGVVQLHPQGMLRTFRARGYDDPFNPYQAVDFLAVMINEGQGSQWAAYRGCL